MLPTLSFLSPQHSVLGTQDWSRRRKPIQLGAVVVHDLARFAFGNRSKVACDFLARERPHAFRVWVVRPPHEVCRAHDFTSQHAGAIILERSVKLATEIHARRFREARLHPPFMVLPPMVHEL